MGLEAILYIFISLVNKSLPLVNMLATFFTFTVLQKGELHPSIAFTSVALFENLADQLVVIGMNVEGTISVIHTFSGVNGRCW